MATFQHLLAAFVLLGGVLPVAAGERGQMVEIEYQGQTRTGTVIAHDGTTGWFLERDGRMQPVTLGEVGRFKEVGTFRPWGIVELREALARDFGSNYTVSASGHYLVVAPRGAGERFARLFDGLYRQFVVAFTARGFRIQEPEFSLIAVILPDQASFNQYCLKEKVRPQTGLRGYYLPGSNRVALFDPTPNGLGGADQLDDTVIHEATHQVAFNLGIHSRMNADPKWVVEGLATVFEREGVRVNDRRGPIAARLNPQRYAWFQQYRQSRRPPNSLATLIQSDDGFGSSALDAYSEAWALTFYLLERQSAEYVSYLRTLSRRGPFVEYVAEDRLRDFQGAFGRDLSLVEAQFLRFYKELAAAME
jgi:hypothetical protein